MHSEDQLNRSSNLHPMVVLQDDEKVLCEIKRHPIGILGMYLSGVLAIALACVFVFVVLPRITAQYADTTVQLTTYAYIGLGVIALITILVLLVATTVYWQNRWIITSDSVTQITQNSLFGRQVSQLSMENLGDVTVDQKGILPHLFNYGTLKVETAGERSKFQFPYCPNPNECARQILEAREAEMRENYGHPNPPVQPV